MANKLALAVITAPHPTKQQKFIILMARKLRETYPTLARADERKAYKALVCWVATHPINEVPIDCCATKSIGIVVGLICDVWNYYTQE